MIEAEVMTRVCAIAVIQIGSRPLMFEIICTLKQVALVPQRTINLLAQKGQRH